MALSEKSRSSLFVALSEVADEEAVEEMLSHFPARDVEEAASKEFIRAEIADLGGDLRVEMADLRSELKGDIAGLRTELKGDIAGLGTELEHGLRVQVAATIGAVAATLGIVTAANGLF